MKIINDWNDAYKELKEANDKAFAGYESWKAEAERLQDKLDDLREEGIEVDVGYVIDGVIDTLRCDPRMPKLTLLEWECWATTSGRAR